MQDPVPRINLIVFFFLVMVNYSNCLRNCQKYVPFPAKGVIILSANIEDTN